MSDGTVWLRAMERTLERIEEIVATQPPR